MHEKFDIGDVVQLNSGGHAMTVYENRDDAKVLCAWHSEDGVPQTEYYPEACLMLA
jgi:uncharacterized protein YodC (DUF2158 family)